MSEITRRAPSRRISLGLLLPAVVFFPMIFNPILFGFYDPASSEDELLAFREENWLAIRLLFTGIGVSFLLLGLGLRNWANELGANGPDRRLAGIAGWAAVAGGALSFLAYGSPWVQSAASYSEFLDSGTSAAVFAVGWISLSGALIVLGREVFRRGSPRWLGVALPLFAVLPYLTGLLPLWFFVGAMVAAVTGLIRARHGRSMKLTAPT